MPKSENFIYFKINIIYLLNAIHNINLFPICYKIHSIFINLNT